MRPMPLPIEMLRRKMRSTMSQSTVATSAAGRPESVLSRMVASAFAETPDGFSTAKCSLSVPSGLFIAQTICVRLALRDVMLLGERPRRDFRRDFLKLIGVAQEQVRPVGGIGKLVERFEKASGAYRGAWVSR